MLSKLWQDLKGGPWIESIGEQISDSTVRFSHPEITVTGNQRLEVIHEYKSNGERKMYLRIQPLIPRLWEDFRFWLASKIQP